jgi:hypothetical protein
VSVVLEMGTFKRKPAERPTYELVGGRHDGKHTRLYKRLEDGWIVHDEDLFLIIRQPQHRSPGKALAECIALHDGLQKFI